MSIFDALQSPEPAAETATAPALSSQPETSNMSQQAVSQPAVQPAAGGLIVEDDAQQLGAGQMRKSEFLTQLKSDVCTTVNAAIAETGRDTDGCPYITNWFDYYARQGSGHLERAILKYAPEAAGATSARGYISAVTRRAGRAAATWAKTGRITGIPDGMPMALPGMNLPGMDLGGGLMSAATGLGSMMFKARPGGARPADNPRAVQRRMGDGRPLDGPVRSRMESAFGRDFSHVRTHTDSNAAGLSGQFNARAFTIGNHVAFGSGEYRPGTLMGDGLIAHELAHVVQQGNAAQGNVKQGAQSLAPMEISSAPSSALERDADVSAAGVMASLLGRDDDRGSSRSQRVMPMLRSGLRLSRCSESKCSDVDVSTKKSVTVNITELYDSSGTPASALTFANDKVYNQANITVKKGKEKSLKDDKGKKESENILGTDYILDEYKSITKPTDEEKKLFKLNQSAGAITMYYVKGLSDKHTGEAFPSYAGVGFTGFVVGNSGNDQTFSHELGHMLLNSGSHSVPDATYLMYKSSNSTKWKLTCDNIKKMRKSTFAT